jgi:hypothetical protein
VALHGVTTQKTPVFIVTAVKTSNLTKLQLLDISSSASFALALALELEFLWHQPGP